MPSAGASSTAPTGTSGPRSISGRAATTTSPRCAPASGRLHPIEDAELGDVRGLRVLHLQCHFGVDTLKLAQRGASVVGLDFSPAAIEAARTLASGARPCRIGALRAGRSLRRADGDPRTRVVRPGVHDLGRHLLAARHQALGRDRRLVPQAGRPALLRRRPSRGLCLRRRRQACGWPARILRALSGTAAGGHRRPQGLRRSDGASCRTRPTSSGCTRCPTSSAA